MGIKQLLPFLSTIIKRTPIRQFRHQKAAIDGYALLHRIATRYPRQIVKNNQYQYLVNGMLNYLSFSQSFK